MNNRRNSGKKEVYGKRDDWYHYITGKIEMIEEIIRFKTIEEIVLNKRRRNWL